MTLINLKSSCIWCAVLTVVVALLSPVAEAFAASTEPIRNVAESTTQNPTETVNPIYYPIAVNAKKNEEGVTPETILRLFMERHTAMDYAASAELALRLIDMIPDRPEGYYNLACALTRLQRFDEALDVLQKSVELGWRDLVHMQLDPDLKPVCALPRFKESVAAVKAAREKEQIAPTAVRAQAWQTVAEELHGRVPEIMERYHVPGAAVALIREGELVWSSQFGIADRRTSVPLDADDRFRVRAPLHLLAIIAAGQQEQLGRMQFAKLLMDGAELDQSPARPINPPKQETADQVSSNGKGADSSDARRRRARCTEIRSPNYSSNSVFGFIRLAMEMATSQPFPEYCEESILKPLDMTQSAFTSSEPADNSLAIGHSKLGSPMNPPPQSDELMRGGAIYTTATDLAKLVKEMMRDGDAIDQIAADSSPRTQMDGANNVRVSSHAAISMVSAVSEQTPRGLGLALDVRKTNYGTRVQVADVASGIGCLMRWYPESQCGVIVLFNSETGFDAAERIAHLAIGGE
jgi:CubicO group peptidase (beta-lactamase class C family)